MTAATTSARATAGPPGAEALALTGRFPPHPVPGSWPETAADRFAVMRRMLAPPFLAENVDARHLRKLTMLKVLDWLELYPGTTWQERWHSCGAGADGTADWRDQAVAELKAAGRLGPRGSQVHNVLGTGMVQLIGGDVLRPALPWLLATTSPTRVAEEMGRTRDPAGIAALRGLLDAGTVGRATFFSAIERIALIWPPRADPSPPSPTATASSCWTAPGGSSMTGPAATGTARSSTSSCTRPECSRPAPRPTSG